MRGANRHYISVSSASSESEDDGDESNDDDFADSVSSSDGASGWSSGEVDRDSLDDDSDAEIEDEEAYCDKVVKMLQGKNDLHTLKVEECRAYLRKHGIRIMGTKATCIERIQEHWRIKEGNGEKLYPRSSFTVNCTGDVCRGDVVLFKQRVYHKFDIARRGGNVIGKRTIAGRVVKESYGAAKQQHTFTVEVLWSKGAKSLPPLFPLLVKGRNLYRLKTFRQRWKEEAERDKVLAEKHRRGAEARRTREISKAKSTNAVLKHHDNLHHKKIRTKGRRQGTDSNHRQNRALPRRGKSPEQTHFRSDAETRTSASSHSKRRKHVNRTMPNKRMRNSNSSRSAIGKQVPLYSGYSWRPVQFHPVSPPFIGSHGMHPNSVYDIGSSFSVDPMPMPSFYHRFGPGLVEDRNTVFDIGSSSSVNPLPMRAFHHHSLNPSRNLGPSSSNPNHRFGLDRVLDRNGHRW